MKFARRLFLIAGIYGLLVLAPQYFTEQKTGRDFPPAITHPEFYYGFLGTAVAWQILFLVLAKDPGRYRAMMLPALVGKVALGAAVSVLFVLGRVSGFLLAFAAVDLLFGALFLVAYARTAAASEGGK